MKELSPHDLNRAGLDFNSALDQGAISKALLIIKDQALHELSNEQRLPFLLKATTGLNQPAIRALCPAPDPELLNHSSDGEPLLSIALFFMGVQKSSWPQPISDSKRDHAASNWLSVATLLLDLGADPMGRKGSPSPLARSLRLGLPLVELALSRGARPSPNDLRLAVDFKIEPEIFSAILLAKKPRPVEIEQLIQRSATRSPLLCETLTAYQESLALV